MSKHRMIVAVLSLVVFGNASALAQGEPGSQQTARLDTQIAVQMGYLVYLPKDYEERESWPLLLFLHGAGERGDDLEQVKRHGPPKLIAQGKEFPFVVISPQCPPDRWWEPTELVALLDDAAGNYKVDPDRVYVTGLSMGGFGTWRLAFFVPNRFAAIAPICGGGEKYWSKAIAHLPIWAFHGAKDALIPAERSESMVDAVKKDGGNPKLTIYPDADHDSWTQAYNDPQLYQWLLEQKRAPQ